MNSNHSGTHIVKYRVYIVVLLILLTLTFISVLVTSVDLGSFAVAGALILAGIKSSLVLWYFMHLKYESRTIKLMIFVVLAIYVSVLISTVLDFVLM